MIQKQVTIKLFFNTSNMSFYVQVGPTIFIINDKVATKIKEDNGLTVRHAKDTKDMQLMSIEDDKIENSL